MFDGGGRGRYRSHTSHSPSNNPVCIGRLLVLSVCVDNIVEQRSQTIHLPSHNHDRQYSAPPESPKYAFPWVGGGEMIQNSHQGYLFYKNQNNTYYPHPSIPPHTIFLFPYCNSSPSYAPYGVVHHLHIPSFDYLYRPPPNFIPSSISTNLLSPDFHPHLSRCMHDHMSNRINK